MSLQGPLIVVAEQPATELVAALSEAGAFPVVETTWADASTAFVAVKPAAVVLAEPGPPPSEAAARMLCLQITTADGPIVPTVGLVGGDSDPALPIALPAEPAVARVVARLTSAQRVRALHAGVLRRYQEAGARSAVPAPLPASDALDDATVLIVGRGPLYPALGVAFGERVKTIGALGVENAARHLNARDVDGVVIGDGFPAVTVEAFLAAIEEDARFRDLPVAVVGEAAAEAAAKLANVDRLEADPQHIVARMLPRLRLNAFAARLARALTSLDAGGLLDPRTGLCTREAFCRELARAIAEASDRGEAFSLARISFEGPLEPRAAFDGARLVTRLVRAADFAAAEDDGSILIAFPATDLRSAHVIARRIAGLLKSAMPTPHRGPRQVAANVTLATLKAGDGPDSLLSRVTGGDMVAAE